MYIEKSTTSLMRTYFQAMGLLVVIVFLCGFSLPHTSGDASSSDNDSVRYYTNGTIADSGFFNRDTIFWFKYDVHDSIRLDLSNDHRFAFHYVASIDSFLSADVINGGYALSRVICNQGVIEGMWEKGASSSDSLLLKLLDGVTHQYKVAEDEKRVLWIK